MSDVAEVSAPELAAGLLPHGAPPLGFGCGDLYGGASQARSERLLRAAFDAGVRYFDVARLYGDGSAEGVVGAALRPVRDQVTIATKAGIVPWSMQLGRRIAYKAARTARRLGPLRALTPEPPSPAERYGAFSVRELRRSVDASLKALGMDRVDLLLLHECKPEHLRSPEVLDFLQGLVRAGKVGGYGVATHLDDTLAILDQAPAAARAVQVPSDAFNRNVRRLPRDGRLVVTHSALRRALPLLQARLAASPEAARRWTRLTGCPAEDAGALARLLTAMAVADNPGGVVLFSTSKPERIAAMAADPVAPEAVNAAREVLDGLRAEGEGQGV